jgi:hypothetical protein
MGCSIGMGTWLIHKVPFKVAVLTSGRIALAFGALFGCGNLMRGC